MLPEAADKSAIAAERLDISLATAPCLRLADTVEVATAAAADSAVQDALPDLLATPAAGSDTWREIASRDRNAIIVRLSRIAAQREEVANVEQRRRAGPFEP